MKKSNIAFLVNGTCAKIPVEGYITYQKGNYLLFGRLIFTTNSTIKDCIFRLNGKIPDNSVMNSLLPEWKLESASLTLTKSLFRVELKSSGIDFSYYKQNANGLLVFSLAKEKIPEGTFFKNLANQLGIRLFTIHYVLGNQRIDPNDSTTSKPQLPVIPNGIFSTGSSFLFTEFNLSQAGFPILRIIGELFGLSDTTLLIGSNHKGEWSCYINFPALNGGILEAKNLYLSFTISNTPSFGLKGEFNLKIGNKSIPFNTQSQFGKEITLSASQLPGNSLDLPPFKLSQMALALKGSSDTINIAMCGRIELRKIDVFGAVAFGCNRTSRIVTPQMFSLAVSDLTLKEVIESIAGINIDANWLNKFSIKGIELPGTESGVPGSGFNEKDLSEWGNFFRRNVETNYHPGDENDFTYRIKDNGQISITDKSYMRHYALSYKNNKLIPQIEAQFLVSKETLQLGDYHIPQGAFVCATLHLLDIEIVAFLNIVPEESVTACMMIAPIEKGKLLTIKGSEGSNGKEGILSPPAIIDCIIRKSSHKNGAVCYFSANKEKGIQFYLDASISLLQIIEIKTRIIFTKGLVSIHANGTLLNVFDYVLSLECQYGEFNEAHFSALLAIDTSKLKAQFRRVQKKIDDAIATVHEKQGSINRKLDEAKRKVDQLQEQVNSFNRQIDGKKSEISRVNIFKKIKIAFQIAGLEIAKTAVVCAMGIARAALNLAQKAVDLSFGLAGGVLKMVNSILSGMMNLFYIERFVIAATVAQQSGFLFNMDFVLFGTKHTISFQKGNLQKDIVGELDDKMAEKVDTVPKEMPSNELPTETTQIDFDLDELIESLEAGKISIHSRSEIMRKSEELYHKYIDDEISYDEKEELDAAYMQDLQRIKEYAGITEVMNRTTENALSALEIPEIFQNLQSKSKENTDEPLNFLQEKESLRESVKKLQRNNGILQETIDKAMQQMKTAPGLKAKKQPDINEKTAPDWNSFALEMENVLKTEADKSIGNHYLVPGYEPSIIESIREKRTILTKHTITPRKGYTPRLD